MLGRHHGVELFGHDAYDAAWGGFGVVARGVGVGCVGQELCFGGLIAGGGGVEECGAGGVGECGLCGEEGLEGLGGSCRR